MAMVHSNYCAGTDGTVLFYGVGNSGDSGDKHLAHLSPVVDCCFKERSEQNVYVDGNKEDSYDDSDDGGDKHLTHSTKAVDSCLKERSKPN
eukprot:10490914-Ditylum_brightwellii.AAC.1